MHQTADIDPSVVASRFINQTNKSVFLTGKAGTGKTTFLRAIIQKTHKRAVIVAPTGIAAINAGGVTIHSQFQLPFGSFIPSDVFPDYLNPNLVVNNKQTLKKHMNMTATKRQTLRSLELLIIDEVSMLRADILDSIDLVLRTVRGDYFNPFGGVQVLFIGDLMQLPPVVKNDEWEILRNYYDGMFFFHAKVLQDEKPLYIELEKIYRQDDITFINILDNLRNNRIETTDLAILNKYYKPNFKPQTEDGYITLTTHNAKAAQQNQTSLDSLPDKAYTFSAEVGDEFPPFSFPTDKDLVLKKGAQIIFIKNDPTGQQRFFNGKIAIVDSISQDEIKVRFKGQSETMTLEKYEWRNIKYTVNDNTKEIDEEIVGTFTQYPVKLAWAITVHKSQGLTFERAIIDVNSAFAPGQVYVALSRLTSLDGLVLTSKINFNGINSDAQVIRFASNKKESDEIKGILEVEMYNFLKDFLYKTFNFSILLRDWRFHIVSYEKIEKNSEKQKHVDWAREQYDALDAQKKYADNFTQQLQGYLETRTPNLRQVAERLTAAKDYFSKFLESILIKTRTHREKMKVYNKTKAYCEELTELEAELYDRIMAFRKAVIVVECVLNGEEITKEHFKSYKTASNTEGGAISAVLKELSESNQAQPIQKASKPKGETYLVTYDLYLSGKKPDEIAEIRGLVVGTIYQHLSHLMDKNKVDIKKILSEERINTIAAALEGIDDISIKPAKEKLGDSYSFGEIRLVKTYLDRKKK
jgi:GTPase SAR1 family protein